MTGARNNATCHANFLRWRQDGSGPHKSVDVRNRDCDLGHRRSPVDGRGRHIEVSSLCPVKCANVSQVIIIAVSVSNVFFVNPRQCGGNRRCRLANGCDIGAIEVNSTIGVWNFNIGDNQLCEGFAVNSDGCILGNVNSARARQLVSKYTNASCCSLDTADSDGVNLWRQGNDGTVTHSLCQALSQKIRLNPGNLICVKGNQGRVISISLDVGSGRGQIGKLR